jgi:methylmalonyl-CoA mutase cobalamin-binding domain/chain
VFVVAGEARVGEAGARALARSIADAGVDVLYLGRETNARRIAVSATEARADAVEVCISGAGAISLLRALLGELNRLDRRQVGIVVHRVQ